MLARRPGLLVLVVATLLLSVVRAEYATEGVRHHRQAGLVEPSLFKSVQHQQRAQKVLAAARALMAEPSCGVAPDPAVVLPTAFGADPTGKADASAAMDRAVAAMLSHKVGIDDMGIYDLGGATLDLDGGSYSLSRPLLIPQHYGNFRVMRGTLFAGPAFPPSAPSDPEYPQAGLHFLLQVGEHGRCNSTTGGASNKNCNTNVGVEQLTLDGRGLANGLMIADSMDNNVGPALLVVGYSHVGISLAGSGAGYIHEVWLGQYPAGSKTPRKNATATGACWEFNALIAPFLVENQALVCQDRLGTNMQ
jgi:hypothetical protein